MGISYLLRYVLQTSFCMLWVIFFTILILVNKILNFDTMHYFYYYLVLGLEVISAQDLENLLKAHKLKA